MKLRTALLAIVACLWGSIQVHAQAEKVILRLEPGGPTSVLTCVAFSPDGERIYAAGFDKVVRVWALDKAKGTFELSKIAYRVPVAPGVAGTINALAVSPDGKWLAVGGYGVMRGRADFRTVGMIFPSLGKSRAMLEDEGAIFVFEVNDESKVKVLRGHAGTILALAFLPKHDRKSPLLVSAAEESTNKPDDYNACVRLWDASKAESLAEKTLNTVKDPRRAPGIVAWHTGGGLKDVHAAIAWQDKAVRVWNVADNGVATTSDGQFNNTVVPGWTAGRFWTGSFDSPNGLVRSWRARPGETPELQGASQITLHPDHPQDGPFYIPRDLAAFSSRPDGQLNRAVVLAARQRKKADPNDPTEDVLFLLDLAENKILAKRTIGKFQLNPRRVAASPTGEHIAVADADNQSVLVYSTKDLLDKRDEKRPQVLRSVGTNFKVVSFRKKANEKKKEDDKGLFLQDLGNAEMIFDFTNRRLLAVDETWKDDSLNAPGWGVKENRSGGKTTVTVSGPGFKEQTIVLGPNCLVTRTAVLPPLKDGPGGPILAIGWLDQQQQPLLALYDVESRTQVRQLTGHTAAVLSLSFSADRKLLASAAIDQTVCLWSMTSYDRVLGKAGALPGVLVVEKAGKVEVVGVPRGSPLKVGDVIEGLDEGGKVRNLANPREFYTALFNTEPKKDITLRVGTKKVVKVVLEVGQGTDERKPLFSLFVTRNADLTKREWIAWTSLGPYEASSGDAEKYLGWHYNPDPDKPGDPVGFASGDKFHDDYAMKELVKYLVRRANVVDAVKDVKDAPKPPPELEVTIDGVNPDGALFRNRQLLLEVELRRPFPIQDVAVSWRMDKGPWQKFGAPADRRWSADLSLLAAARGEHTVEVRLEMDDNTPPLKSLTTPPFTFKYLPKPPLITYEKEWLKENFPALVRNGMRTDTDKKSFDLQFVVQSEMEDEEVFVQVRQNNKLLKEYTGRTVRVKDSLALKEDEVNLIEIVAVNKGASNDEPARKLEVTIAPMKIGCYPVRSAPRIIVTKVVPLKEGAEPAPVQPGQPIKVSFQKVLIEGYVEGDENLQGVLFNDKPMDGFMPGKEKRFDFKVELTLKTGKQVLEFEGKTARSPVGRETIQIEYMPTVAQIVNLSLADPTPVYKNANEIRVELEPPDNSEEYTAKVLVNDRPQAERLLKANASEIKEKVTLDPGRNKIVVRLHNEWGDSTEKLLHVTYLRPPLIDKFEPLAKVAKPVQDFTAEVRSDLKPTRAWLNDTEYRLGDRLEVKEIAGRMGFWEVKLLAATLIKGDNTLTLVVANEDGKSTDLPGVKAVTRVVNYDKPPPPAPLVKFKDEFQDGVVYQLQAPKYDLEIIVESKSPLTRVELLDEKDKNLFPKQAAGLILNEKVTVKPSRVNTGTTYRLIAYTEEGGRGEVRVTLKAPVEQPAYVVIESLESTKKPGTFFKPLLDKKDKNGQVIIAEEIPEGKVTLHGRIYWTDKPTNTEKVLVRVFANGFQQIPVTAPPPKPGEMQSTFTATVLLTQKDNNALAVELTGVKQGERQGSSCIVETCKNPIQGRKLHVVAIAVKGKPDDIKRNALKAINAVWIKETNRWKAPPIFGEVDVHDPIIGRSRSDVLRELGRFN